MYTVEQMHAYAELTGDRNPLHLDPEFAAQTPYGAPVVFGTLVLNEVWRVLSERGINPIEGSVRVRFLRPVYVHDRLKSRVIDGRVELYSETGDDPVLVAELQP